MNYKDNDYFTQERETKYQRFDVVRIGQITTKDRSNHTTNIRESNISTYPPIVLPTKSIPVPTAIFRSFDKSAMIVLQTPSPPSTSPCKKRMARLA